MNATDLHARMRHIGASARAASHVIAKADTRRKNDALLAIAAAIRRDAVALKAGLCQWHGWLDESHQLSQSVEGLGRNHGL